MKNFILGVILTSLLSFGMYLYLQNQSLISQVNTLKSNIISNNNNLQKVKESYYIEQQNRDTTLILFTVTALIALFSATTFIGVKSEFKTNVAKIEDKYNEQITKYEESVIHISNLKSNISFQYADRINNDFCKVLKEKPLDVPSLIFLGLMSCQNYCHTIEYSTSNVEEIKPRVFKYITTTLDVMVSKVKVVDKVELESLTYEMFLEIKNTLDLNLDKDSLQKFAIIFSKLSFPTLE
jgi:hypothetical protein